MRRSLDLRALLSPILLGVSVLVGTCLLGASVALAATVTGTVHNGTTNKVSPGDDVILISLQQRMQETARTKTDAKGQYSLEVPDQGFHLIRVDHQKASYFQPAPPNLSKIDVQVYDVAPNVPGITTEASVVRLETNPQGMRVTQSYFVKNDSSPPRTQFSSHSYEIYLPPDAKIEGAAAMGPGGMPVASSPAPEGEKGHYAYLFPLRPGETQFQVTYSLPYSGKMQFTPRLATPADNVVVMLPKSMTFKPVSAAPYQPINDDINAQTFVAKNVSPTQPLGFEVSGSGSLPRDVQTAQSAGSQPGSGPAPGAAEDTRPGGGLGNPIDTPDPLNKYKWWILGAVGLVLAIAAALFLRRPAATPESLSASTDAALSEPLSPRAAASRQDQERGYPEQERYAARSIYADQDRYAEQQRLREQEHLSDQELFDRERFPPSANEIPEPVSASSRSYRLPPVIPEPLSHRETLLNALKEELFSLETDRAQGNVGEVEYASYKQALEAVIRRAVSR